VRTTESSGWILFSQGGKVEDSGPPVEYGDEESVIVDQLHRWWRRNLEKSKSKAVTTGRNHDGQETTLRPDFERFADRVARKAGYDGQGLETAYS
jgi:hypothetical protein